MTNDDASVPATFGGPGWQVRMADHQADLAAGTYWRPAGINNEYDPLEAVLISAPSPHFAVRQNPESWLMLEWPDLAELETECAGIEAYFTSKGITCHIHRPSDPPPPNYLFMRDLIFMTPDGAYIGRPASPIRAPEARWAAQAIAELGIPLLGMPTGEATFEGADALWLDEQTVVIGHGARTNTSGAEWLTRRLAEQGVEVITVPVPAGAQHLLGVVVPISSGRALVDVEHMSAPLSDLLNEREIEQINVEPGPENRYQRGMNVVVLGPDQLVMPAGCPQMAAQFRSAGIEVDELPVNSYVKAAGALGCLTSIIRRSASHPR